MEPALIEADHERVPRDASARRVTERGGKVPSSPCAERFASSKPEQGIIREPLTHGVESRMMPMARAKQVAVERLAIDEHAAPLAMAPKLHLANRSRGIVPNQPGECVLEAVRTVRPVDATEGAVEVSAVLPTQPERSWRARTLRRVVDDQTQRIPHARLGTAS